MERSLGYRTIREIEMANPDVFLLAGGIEGGNDEVIVANARMIVSFTARAPVVVVGISVVTEEVCRIIRSSGRSVLGCPNVMPALNKLNVEGWPGRSSRTYSPATSRRPMGLIVCWSSWAVLLCPLL